MTDAKVKETVLLVKEKFGRTIDPYDAAVYLQAQEILEQDKNNPDARAVIKNFSTRILTGTEPVSFAQFALPIPYTDEHRAEMALIRAKYLAATGEQEKEVDA